MKPTLSIDTIPPEILSAAAKVSEWCEKNAGHYWQLAGLCDRRYAFRAELFGQYPIGRTVQVCEACQRGLSFGHDAQEYLHERV